MNRYPLIIFGLITFTNSVNAQISVDLKFFDACDQKVKSLPYTLDSFEPNQALIYFKLKFKGLLWQIRRLRELALVEKVKNDYRITEFGNLKEIFNENEVKMVRCMLFNMCFYDTGLIYFQF